MNETRATISKAAAIGKPRRPLVVEYEPSEGRSAIATLEADQTRPYKIAASVFRYSGFTLTQTKRAGNVAIYKQAKGKQSPAFEVVIIRKAEAWTAFGREFPATEYYPANEDFGAYGFTFRTLEGALAKFEELVGKEERAR